MAATTMQMGSKRWWAEKRGKRHDAIVHAEGVIKNQMKSTLSKFERFEKLYAGEKSETSIGSGRVFALSAGPGKKLPPVIFNGVKAVIDTKRAKITGTDVRPFAITDGGTWKQKRRAKKLTKFTDGLFYETEMRTKGPEFYRHSRVLGTASFKVFEKDARPTVEQVDLQELRIDAEDAAYGNPRMMIQVKPVHREVLREMFDGEDGRPKALQPEAVTKAKSIERRGQSTFADRVLVYEAWHLPSGPGADDGVHVICTAGGTLVDEPWEEKDFPFIFLRADNRLFGFWGVGDAEDLEGLQFQLDKLNKTIQLCLHLCSVPGYAMPNGANVVAGKLTNDVGRIVRYDGSIPPTPLQPPPVPPELLEERNEILQTMFQLKGVSEAAAASQVPAGITGSGEAQRVYADTQVERFSPEGKTYEEAFVRVGKKLIQLARRIHKRNKKFSVRVPGRKFMESVDWDDIDLDDEEFDLQILPTSNMPKTLSGRLALAQELLQGGFIKDPQTEGRRLLDFPDLDDDTSMALAVVDYLESEIDHMLDGGKMRPLDWPMLGPEGLQIAIGLGQRHWLRAKVDGAPKKILDTLSNWLTEAGARKALLSAPPPGALPGGPGPGPGVGQPAQAPTSSLLPAAH